MSITAAELIWYGALNRPQDDASASGGGIDVDYRPSFTQLAATDDIEVLSSSGADTTQTVTVIGRNAAGELVTASALLTGVTPAILTPATQFERVLDVSMDGDAAGIVTVQRSVGGAEIGTIPIGERGFFAMFIDAASEAGAVDRFEKIFAKNINGSLTLTNSTVTLTDDPSADANHNILIAVEDSLDDTNNEGSSRKATVGGVGDPAFDFSLTWVDDDVAVDVPAGGNGNLTFGSAIGVWVRQDLAANASALKSTFTVELAGTTV
jgi:hypothetical protein